ncbi:MAG: M67 family metallopeptidase [Clostridiales bacterium]|nr:M67 family metallopeptidase [Clostridiales bacterium]
MLYLNQEHLEIMLAHARMELPNEACGLIAGTRDGEDCTVERVYCLTNTDHSSEHFSIDPREQLTAIREMRAQGLVPLGNWHSHPESPSRPSAEDRRLARDPGARYLILSLQGEAQLRKCCSTAMNTCQPVLHAFRVRNGVSFQEKIKIQGEAAVGIVAE